MPENEKIQPIIEVENLNVTYFMGKSNEVRALQNVGLKIYPGEFIIFFGPSGCGKSTLLYSIAGLETHARGKIIVNGNNVADMDKHLAADFRQRQIGMIFQAFYLINSLTVQKNVVLPQIAIKANVEKRTAKAQELLRHFGVDTQASKLPSELSGGQQQRVAICRALINDPEIVLADEPTGNLDSKSAHDVMELVNELNEKQKKTIILVTHDPAHLHFAHRVFYMKDGKIIDTRVNRAISQHVLEAHESTPKPSVSRELELLIRTYSSIAPGQIGTMLIPFKAKQIVAESLTGMSSEEIGEIEKQVQHMLISSLEDKKSLADFLDKPKEMGGIELDKRSAERLAEKISDIVNEIKQLQAQEKQIESGQLSDTERETKQLREHVLDTFNIEIKEPKAVDVIDTAITERLGNVIDMAGLTKKLDTPVRDGGAGLDRRTAKKVAKYVELLQLGKYNA